MTHMINRTVGVFNHSFGLFTMSGLSLPREAESPLSYPAIVGIVTTSHSTEPGAVPSDHLVVSYRVQAVTKTGTMPQGIMVIAIHADRQGNAVHEVTIFPGVATLHLHLKASPSLASLAAANSVQELRKTLFGVPLDLWSFLSIHAATKRRFRDAFEAEAVGYVTPHSADPMLAVPANPPIGVESRQPLKGNGRRSKMKRPVSTKAVTRLLAQQLTLVERDGLWTDHNRLTPAASTPIEVEACPKFRARGITLPGGLKPTAVPETHTATRKNGIVRW